MKNKKSFYIIISLTILLLGGGIVFVLVQNQKTQTTENSTVSSPTKNDSPNPITQKRTLANQIKEDLQKDLEKVKEGDTNHHLTYANRPWGGCGVPSGEEGYIVLLSPNVPENKGKRNLIAPSELEKEDYEEIVSLVKQVNTTREKVVEQKRQEGEVKLDQKLSSNSKMFFSEGLWEWSDLDDIRHVFRGVESGQGFYLVFPENHPATANLPKQRDQLQQKNFYLIEGVENIPFQPEKERLCPWKEANLSDKITITFSNS